MKRTFIFLVAMLVLLGALSADDGPVERYIRQYAPTAVSEMRRSGVPASITLAQGILESAAGTSRLAVKANNHFGIKCGSLWKGRSVKADDDARNECFRSYGSAAESFRDHSDFLRYRDRYAFLFELEPSDYKGWAYGLKQAGYATDPAYPSKLISLIERYNLTQYDALPSEQAVLPSAPRVLEQPVVPAAAKERIRFATGREMLSSNGVPFVYAAAGETYASIAQDFHLFPKEILRFNDASPSDALHPGDIVYLQAKKNKAAKGLDKHIADGETLREVSRRFAVKLKALCKMNALDADYVTVPGDEIRLR